MSDLRNTPLVSDEALLGQETTVETELTVVPTEDFAKLLEESFAESEKKPVSKYAAKKAGKGKKEAKKAEAPSASLAVETKVEENLPLDLFGDLDAFLLGDKQKELDEMTAMRAQAEKLMAQCKAINMFEVEKKNIREADEWTNQQLRDADRQMFNHLREAHATDGKFEIFKDAFLKLQNSKDAAEKAKFNDMRLKVINANPRMKKLHEDNLVRAERCLSAIEEAKANKGRLYQQAVEMFDLANLIANENGWPKTEARKEAKAK